MSQILKQYRTFHRSYLIKVINWQREGIQTYPVSLFNKELEEELSKVGFFDKHEKISWWTQDINPLNFENTFRPDFEHECNNV